MIRIKATNCAALMAILCVGLMGQGCPPITLPQINPANTPPTADAGPDQTLTPGQTTTLDASGSSDPDGDSLSYSWTQTYGPDAGLSDLFSMRPIITPPELGEYEFAVTTSDGRGGTDVDTVRVSVATDAGREEPDPTIVHVTAGPDQLLSPGDSVVLGGWASGGSPPYQFLWTPAAGLDDPSKARPIASPSVSTVYTLTVTDSIGNTGSDNMQVGYPLKANAGADRIVPPIDSVVLTGSANGGIPPYQYAWTPTGGLNDPVIAQPTASPTMPTIYTLTVTDSAGFTASDTVYVSLTLLVGAGPVQTITQGAAARLTGLVSGGRPPYQYSWSPTPGLDDPTSLQPVATPSMTTEYVLTVTDSDGMIASAHTTVAVFQASAGPKSQTIMAGDSIQLTASAIDGVPPYQYAWTPAAGLNESTSAHPLVSPTVTTVYTVTITDSAGHQASDTVRVTVALTADVGEDRVIGFGTSVRLGGTVMGGTPPYTYSWIVYPWNAPAPGEIDDPTSLQPLVKPAGRTRYGLQVQDSDGATAFVALNVFVLHAVATPKHKVIALGDSVTLDASIVWEGGVSWSYQYAWTPVDGLDDPTSARPHATPTNTTTYTVTVTDSSGTTTSDTAEVIVSLQVSAGQDRYLSRGDSTALDSSVQGGLPPYHYSWSHADSLDDSTSSHPTASPSAGATEYTLTVTDSTGLSASDSTIVAVGTVVQGIYSNDTIWSASNSPYIIPDQVHIPAGITLVIEPGVELLYLGNGEIYVQGAIIANGSPAQRISFRGFTPPGPDYIFDEPGTTFITFVGATLSASQLNYVVMKTSAKAIRLGQHPDEGDPKNTGVLTVSHGELEATEVLADENQGWSHNTRLVLADCALTSTIVVYTVYSDPIDIVNSAVTGCQITSDATLDRAITLTGCAVNTTRFFVGYGPPNLLLQRCTLDRCAFERTDDDDVNLALDHCKSVNTWINLKTQYSEVSISDCSFTYDATPYLGTREPEAKLVFAFGTIQYSTITGNTLGTGISILPSAANNPVTISHCTIQQNETGVLIGYSAHNCAVINSNVLSNSRFALKNDRAWPSTATNNYWGTDDVLQIRSMIYDDFDDVNLGTVTFEPFSPVPIADAGPRP